MWYLVDRVKAAWYRHLIPIDLVLSIVFGKICWLSYVVLIYIYLQVVCYQIDFTLFEDRFCKTREE